MTKFRDVIKQQDTDHYHGINNMLCAPTHKVQYDSCTAYKTIIGFSFTQAMGVGISLLGSVAIDKNTLFY